MKKIAIIFIIVGFAIALYPLIENTYTSYSQQRIITDWEEQNQQSNAIADHGGNQGQENFNTTQTLAQEPEEKFEPETLENNSNRKEARHIEPIGVVDISKINLELPIFEGATDYHLDLGAALLEEGAYIGETGNAMITAHRGHRYGRLFNRLDELEIDDKVVIKTKNNIYSYKVYDSDIVDAEDEIIWQNNNSKEEITLITCHPLYKPNPPYRLIVKAERIQD